MVINCLNQVSVLTRTRWYRLTPLIYLISKFEKRKFCSSSIRMSNMSIKFNNGLSCPILGLGTAKSKPDEVVQAVECAIDIGYRHFDCAHVYQNEKEVGKGVKSKIDEGKVVRSDLFITSKLWNTAHKPELVEPALKTTLCNLGLDYIDLYLIHWPMGFKEGEELFPTEDGKILYSDSHYTETWKAMEELVKKGLTKSIGVSNFNKRQVKEILSIAEIKPVNNQIECHPYLNQKQLIDCCTSNGITITAYSPLGSPARDQPCGTPLLEDPILAKIGDKYNKTPSQVLIRYQIERNIIVIPKSVTKSRIQQNFEVFDFNLSPEDMECLNNLNKEMGRVIPFKNVTDHKNYPFNDPF